MDELTLKARAEWYMRIMALAVPVEDFKEATDNILISIGFCYKEEDEEPEDILKAICLAYEAEFSRLKIDTTSPTCSYLLWSK